MLCSPRNLRLISKCDEPSHELNLTRHCAACLLQVLEVEHNKGKIKLRATDGTEKCTVALNSQICAQWASNEDLRSGCLLRLKADGLSYNQLQGEFICMVMLQGMNTCK